MPRTKKLIYFFSFLVTFTVLSGKAFAQENIKAFDTSILINKDGTVDVIENITYDFGTQTRHGIYREIPLIKTNEDGQGFKLGIDNVKVKIDDNREVPYEKKLEDTLHLKIGDPSKTITGEHKYTISYTVSGALTYFEDFDELYWNITGNGWDVPIEQAFALVSVPDTVPTEKISQTCYTGVKGSAQKSCLAVQQKAHLVSFRTLESLQPKEGMTVAVNFPKGYVEELLPQRDKSQILEYLLYGLAGIVLFLFNILLPGKKLMQLIKQRKNLKSKSKIVATWFDPPKKEDGRSFSPAETKAIVSGKVDHKSITAEIIKLAQKGYLKIQPEGKKHFRFVQLKNSDASLKDFQHTILTTLFNLKREVTTKDLKKSKNFGTKYATMTKQIVGHLDEDGIYEKDLNKLRVKNSLIAIGSGLIFGFVNMLVYIAATIWERPYSKFGIDAYSKAKSLENFLKSQDEQFGFQADKQMFFERLLPYATAFGVEDIWVKRFRDLQLKEVDWYEGDMTAVQFAAMSTALNRGVKGAVSTASKSSSGFSSGSSGGFSGGGGGGGGGGSW